jgi:two-component system, OmpR family, KDP operon response regulator KdpE
MGNRANHDTTPGLRRVQRGGDVRSWAAASPATKTGISSARDRRGTALGALDATVPPTVKHDGPRVLLVHDTPAARQPLSLLLADEGFEVEAVADVEAARAVGRGTPPAIILLYLAGSTEMIFELVHQLRRRLTVPIVIISARASAEDRVRALDMGADDVLAAPIDGDELSARLRAVLRRSERHTRHVPPLVVGDLTIDFERRLLSRGGTIVPLGRTEWLVLRHLARNPGKVVLNTELLNAVWGDGYANDLQVLRICISRLRTKLGTTGRAGGPIRTFHNVGYALEIE